MTHHAMRRHDRQTSEADIAATMREDAARTATWALSLEEISGKRRATQDW